MPASVFSNTAIIATTSVETNTANNTAEAGLVVQNVAPVAEDDDYAADYETLLDMDAAHGVLSNDIDVNDDPLTATLDSGPTGGALSLALDGSFVYTPAASFSGLDSFGYVVSDGALTDTATVFIDVGLVPTCTLTTLVSPTLGGSVTLDPPGGVYDMYTPVQLTAAPSLENPPVLSG